MIVSVQKGMTMLDFANSVFCTNGPFYFASSISLILQLPIYAILASILMEMSSGPNKSWSIGILALKPLIK